MKSILMMIEDLRERIKSHVGGEISDVLITEFVDTTFDDIDILSTHSVVDYSQVDDHYVDSICSDYVKISVDGTVFYNLQWGSGSDMKNGIGASMSESFPYQAIIHAKLQDFKKLELSEAGINIDTDSWYE